MLVSTFWKEYLGQVTEAKSVNRSFQFKVVRRITALMSLGAFLWTILMVIMGAYDLLLVPVFYLLISSFTMYLCQSTSTSVWGCNIQMIVSILFPCLFQLIAGGAIATGAVMVWSLVALFSISTYRSSRSLVRWTAFTFAVLGATVLFEYSSFYNQQTILEVSPLPLMVFNSVLTYSVIFYIGYFFVKMVEKGRSNLRSAVLEVKELNKELQERNDDHMEGMKHARDIQMAFFKSEDHLRTVFTKLFLLRGAREFVSGDFIWAEQKGDYKYMICGDCSTKGSSYGLLTMLMVSTIERILQENDYTDPGIFLTRIDESLRDYSSLDLNWIKLDMKLTMLIVHAKTNKTKLATSGGSILVKHSKTNELKKYAVDNAAMGSESDHSHYSSMDIDLAIGDIVYVYTDGYQKQINDVGEPIGEENFQTFRERSGYGIFLYAEA